MASPTIVLHQWAISPFCGKVRRILDHKGLAFTTVEYNGLKARGAAKLTPTGKLPVIDYDGERVADSSEIARFLDERHPTPPLYPADPVARARVHFWEDWADEALYWFEIYFRFMYPAAREQAVALLSEGRPAYERMLLGRVVYGMYKKKLVAQGLGRLTQAQVEARFLAHLDALEVLLGEAAWLTGDARTIADLAVASQLAEIVRTGHIAGEVTGRPRLGAWLARCG